MMIDSDLLAELDALCARDERLARMPPEVTNGLLIRVAHEFKVDTSRLWWWEGIPGARSVPYLKDAELPELARLLLAEKGGLALVVTGDEPPPWAAVSGSLPALLELLENLPYCEFFIVDEELRWILFDTHDGEFVIAGSLPEKGHSPA